MPAVRRAPIGRERGSIGDLGTGNRSAAFRGRLRMVKGLTWARPGRGTEERRSGTKLGILTGAIGLGCCLYPVALVLLGISSAASAVSLGRYLYGTWSWAFRLAAVAFAVAALAVQRRRALSCPADRRPRLGRTAAWLVGSGVLTYAVLYAVTTALGALAT